MLFAWIIVFLLSLSVLVYGSDWVLAMAERVGERLRFPPFIVGLVLIGIGTSLPELISGIVGVVNGVPEIVVSNAIGSNIANVFLITGIGALCYRFRWKTAVSRIDLGFLIVSTVVLLGSVIDRRVTVIESLVLITVGVLYLFHASHERGRVAERRVSYRDLRERRLRYSRVIRYCLGDRCVSVSAASQFFEYATFVIALVSIAVAAHVAIESVVRIASVLNAGVGALGVTAVAIGTSLPELAVSLQALRRKQGEIAIGNVIGSNIFNAVFVVGIPAFFRDLPVDRVSDGIGVPVLICATALVPFYGFRKHVPKWAAIGGLILYGYFLVRVIGFFA